MTDEKALIRSAQKGSHAAFAELVELYKDRVYRLVLRVIRDPENAEDVTQDVFVKVFEKIEGFNFRSTFFTWVYRITVNTAMDHAKRARRRAAVSLSALEQHGIVVSWGGEGPSARMDREELRRRVHEILDSLPPKYRTVLVLREFENLSYDEMAGVLGCSIGTVESRLFRARARFREKLELEDRRSLHRRASGPFRGRARSQESGQR